MCPQGINQAHHITPSQWMVLKLIDQQKEVSVKALAKKLSISSSATTQLIDGLVKEEYVQRKENPDDRRSILLTLHKKAHTRMKAMKKEAFKQLSKLFDALTDEELDQYLALNRKITQTIIPQ